MLQHVNFFENQTILTIILIFNMYTHQLISHRKMITEREYFIFWMWKSISSANNIIQHNFCWLVLFVYFAFWASGRYRMIFHHPGVEHPETLEPIGYDLMSLNCICVYTEIHIVWKWWVQISGICEFSLLFQENLLVNSFMHIMYCVLLLCVYVYGILFYCKCIFLCE